MTLDFDKDNLLTYSDPKGMQDTAKSMLENEIARAKNELKVKVKDILKNTIKDSNQFHP